MNEKLIKHEKNLASRSIAYSVKKCCEELDRKKPNWFYNASLLKVEDPLSLIHLAEEGVLENILLCEKGGHRMKATGIFDFSIFDGEEQDRVTIKKWRFQINKRIKQNSSQF